jgi:HEAT repeat protein
MDVQQAIVELACDDAAQRAAAAERLAQEAENARRAAISLVLAASDPDEVVREWAVAALESLGSPSMADQTALADLLSDPRLDTAFWAATLLGRLGSEAKNATSALAHAVQSHPEVAVRQQAAQALGKIGPSAADAVSVLEEAASNTDARLARNACQALKAIQGGAAE